MHDVSGCNGRHFVFLKHTITKNAITLKFPAFYSHLKLTSAVSVNFLPFTGTGDIWLSLDRYRKTKKEQMIERLLLRIIPGVEGSLHQGSEKTQFGNPENNYEKNYQQIYVLFEILSDFERQVDVANKYNSETEIKIEQTEQTGMFEVMEQITVLRTTMDYTINQISMAESHRVINEVQFMIFMGSPVHLAERMTTGTHLSGNTYHWWTHRHPHLHDGRGICDVLR
ncbi:uncharacterized protein EV154DRAFT_555756 [Mucor mucedo]|uniref:uncharacterized protein n=1 Tax=Mucor mucedo TaxID=29922 RepID=UPI00221FC885|nr:uncharacterized protein EV154DRAFT_555756 [Mucor mucedo]KAI7876313.1 hypothetical protein EV154DRAFT_555756 [Mucor mucedo]